MTDQDQAQESEFDEFNNSPLWKQAFFKVRSAVAAQGFPPGKFEVHFSFDSEQDREFDGAVRQVAVSERFTAEKERAMARNERVEREAAAEGLEMVRSTMGDDFERLQEVLGGGMPSLEQ